MTEEDARYFLSLHYLITLFEMGSTGGPASLEHHLDRYPLKLDDTWNSVIAKLGACWSVATYPHEVQVAFADHENVEPSLLERQARNAVAESVNAYLNWDFHTVQAVVSQASEPVKRFGVGLALRHVAGLMCAAHAGHQPYSEPGQA